MRAIIDNIECQRDSPRFRQVLEENEKDLDILESKLEKVVKQCNQMVAAGKQFNQEQEQLIHTLWDCAGYFSDDSSVQAALNRMLSALREAAKYHVILVDQAARAVTKNLSSFIKNELHKVKDLRHYFEKVSGDMDSVLHRASGVSRTRTQDVNDINNLVIATRRAFRHTAVDYVHAMSIAQGKKRHEVVGALLSYLKAYSTFYHQGTDLCDDLKPSLEKISEEVNLMRQEVSDLDKNMENRHTDVTDKDLVLSVDQLDNSQPVTMYGYLFKRTTNAFKSWNRRYFTLQNNQLVYRKRSGEEVTVMEEDLRLCTVKAAVDVDRRFCFEVVSPFKCHMLQAESEESYNSWISALQRGIGQALQLSSHENSFTFGNDTPSPLNPPKGPGATTTPGDSNNSSPATTPQASTAHKAHLWQELMSIPGNDLCCDCGASNPRWASINLGVTLCIECSGIHRSLGVHYSKVRSLTLDAWDPEMVKVMHDLGNSVINRIYLATYIPGEGSGPPAAKPDSQRSVREDWIKMKYVERRYVKPLPTASETEKNSNQRRTWGIPRRQRHLRAPRVSKSSSGSLDASLSSAGDTHDHEESHSEITNISPEADTPTADVLLLNIDVQSPARDAQEILETSDDYSTDNRNLNNVTEEPLSSLHPDMVLYRASEADNLGMISYGLALEANKNWHNPEDNGQTPLHQAVASCSVRPVQHLLTNGAKVNEQDCSGRTPLHLAALKSNIGQVCLFLKHRVDLNIKDNDGQKAIDLAVQSNEPDVVTLLRVASLSEDIDRDGGGEDNNMLTDFLRDFQEKMVKQVHNRSLQKDGEIPL
ncbi:arf-GAP with coiled-coil, ANK repeat and PH domain-containing protein 2-like isoform X2 [Portunus trituberculatus]|uniref:arf-GAP with coiled-coil, ANK repeat and PH domain-containing protein 2-like isoform X2 n=1 Tax=Portunus trituberculatus TaxID=210409 RepID=UPI001E1CC970|nr:arf-GAP with coiled-coil, ANK repeat and PH domain-containing protein 2-like isoform X2 [Portunus trituberculatus]